MTFTFRPPGEIIFGRGAAAEAAGRLSGLSDRVLVVHGRSAERAAWLVRDLEAAGASVLSAATDGEPDIAQVRALLDRARDFKAGAIAGLGGGSAIDAAKAVAALVGAPGDPADYLEGQDGPRPLDADPLPWITLPTTSGTGAEATKNAVIGLPDKGKKVSLRDDRMLATAAIVDPSLTDGLPHVVTMASGLDAVTQLIEAWLSAARSPITDALVRGAMPEGLRALVSLASGEKAADRDAMAFASLSSGLALANGGLGAVHGFAGVLGGRTGAPHGELCARLLVPVLRCHRRKAAATAGLGERLDTVERWIAEVFSGSSAPLDALAEWIDDAGIRRLSGLGYDSGASGEVARASASSSSMRKNPWRPEERDLHEILDEAT